MRADAGLRCDARLGSGLHASALTHRGAHAGQVGGPLVTDAAQLQFEIVLALRHDDENADSCMTSSGCTCSLHGPPMHRTRCANPRCVMSMCRQDFQSVAP